MSAFELINERMTSRTVLYDDIWRRQMEMKYLIESVCVILNRIVFGFSVYSSLVDIPLSKVKEWKCVNGFFRYGIGLVIALEWYEVYV